MNFTDYQTAALRTARDKNEKDELFHLLLGLCGEAGEIAEKMKKIVRDKNSDFTIVDKADLTKELGDVLWHIATIADYFEIDLDTVATANIANYTLASPTMNTVCVYENKLPLLVPRSIRPLLKTAVRLMQPAIATESR